ncbi:hypothetical protein [Fredinandcohnia quinoae]|uniref:Uncharacterized protein n=1 Tax=Fredinandcohnia quinoae TaxID=2918902 RepID=A0AAW5E9S3_9BACI|nr:hypothetical protein [Fredinandcohnia sp. SECRCQ15]MCH1627754.1 hypothetical protein [Fredinandcohnia sp. SECRCQ15]
MLIDLLLNSWLGIGILIAIPLIFFSFSSRISKKMRKDIEKNPYDHRNNPPPPPGGGIF